MGLFDKRDKRGKKDDFDSPVEQIDLSQPSPLEAKTPAPAAKGAATPVAPPPAPSASAHNASPPGASAASPSGGGQVAAGASAAQPPAAVAPAVSRAVPRHEEEQDYGVDKAIELMRGLPTDNVELVVQVVKVTLESAKIRIGAIIEDAGVRLEEIQGRVKHLKGEIADLEQEIAQRRDEIGKLDSDFRETTMVKDRLQLAERLTKKGGPIANTSGNAAADTEAAIDSAPPQGERNPRGTGPLPPLSSSPAASGGAGAASTGSGSASAPRPASVTANPSPLGPGKK